MKTLLLALCCALPALAQSPPSPGSPITTMIVASDPSGNCSNYNQKQTNVTVTPPREWLCVNAAPLVNKFGTWTQSNVTGGGATAPATPLVYKGNNTVNGIVAATPGTDYVAPINTSEPISQIAGISQPYSYTAANGVARSQTQINSETLSLTRLGAVPDCSTNTAPAWQTFFDTYAPLGYTLWVPPPFPGFCYALSSSGAGVPAVNIPFSAGWSVVGASQTGTIVKMFTNNATMFQFSAENTRDYTFQNLAFYYNTQQTAASNPNSAVFLLNPATSTGAGVYGGRFQDLEIVNAFRGFDITGQNPWWGTTWRNINFDISMTGGGLHLLQSPAIGVERSLFDNLKFRQNITEPQMSLSNCSNCIFQNSSFLNGSNLIANLQGNSNISLNQIHIEAHAFTGSGAAIDLANSGAIIDGISYSGSSAASLTNYVAQSTAGGGYVGIRNYNGVSTIGSGSTMNFIHGSTSGASVWSLEGANLSAGFGKYNASDAVITAGLLIRDDSKIWLNPLGTSTSGGNFSSQPLTVQGSGWNGSAAGLLGYTIQDVVGSGTNPTHTLTVAGSGGTIAGVALPNNVAVANSGTAAAELAHFFEAGLTGSNVYSYALIGKSAVSNQSGIWAFMNAATPVTGFWMFGDNPATGGSGTGLFVSGGGKIGVDDFQPATVGLNMGLGNKYACKHGTNGTCGVITLTAGAATISTTAIAALAASGAAGDIVHLECANNPATTTTTACATQPFVSAITAGTSFVIGGTLTDTVYWEIRHIN